MIKAGGISLPQSGRWYANAKSPLARREEGGNYPEVPLFGPPTLEQPLNQVGKEGDLGGGGLRGLSLRDRPSRQSLDLTPNPSPSPKRIARLSLNRAKGRRTGRFPFKERGIPFGNGANPFGIGLVPFKHGANPIGNGAHPFENGANPFGIGVAPFKNRANLFGNGGEKSSGFCIQERKMLSLWTPLRVLFLKKVEKVSQEIFQVCREKSMGINSDFLPSPDPAFQAWLNNFSSKATLYEAELDLSAEDLFAIQAFATTFAADLNAVDEAKETLKGLVADKNADRAEIASDVRAFARRFKGIAGISPGILSALGIVSSNTLGPVVTITDLVVTGCSTGMNSLSWNRNGNGSGTQFIIESSANGTTGWELVAVTTRVTYEHKNQVPGVQKFYRVTSNRAGETSNPSQAAVVYQNGGSNTLQIAA